MKTKSFVVLALLGKSSSINLNQNDFTNADDYDQMGEDSESFAQQTFNETYNSFDGSVHNNDTSRTINGRKVTDKHQIDLNFGTDP